MAMKPGRFWFSEPSPYVTQAPTLGRGRTESPQFISISDGSWFGTWAYIERITAMSSMCSAVLANSSLTSMPLWPYLWNLNGEGNAAPVLRSVVRFCGAGLPGVLLQGGLGVEGVDLRRPAVEEEVDDPFGPRGEVRRLHGHGVAGGALGRRGPLARPGGRPGPARPGPGRSVAGGTGGSGRAGGHASAFFFPVFNRRTSTHWPSGAPAPVALGARAGAPAGRRSRGPRPSSNPGP